MAKINIRDIVGQEIKEVTPCDEYIILKLANDIEFEACVDSEEDGGKKYVGQTIKEFLPYHDGAEVTLSDGTVLDGMLCGDFEEQS